jgi:hypothetical protein
MSVFLAIHGTKTTREEQSYSESTRKPNICTRNASVKAELCTVADNLMGKITAEKIIKF